MRSGTRWRDIPEEKYALGTIVYFRYRNRVQFGFWKELLQRLNGLPPACRFDWSANFVDGTTILLILHKVTAGLPSSKAIGISRVGLTTKVHVRVGWEGHLLNVEKGETTAGFGCLQDVDEHRAVHNP